MAEGGCHCGAVRYAVDEAPRRVALCHCADCRRCAGAPMVAWAVFPQARFRVLRGEPALYASSEHAARAFCPACGTGLWYVSETFFPGQIDVQVATLDDPDRFPPSQHVQTAERIGWMARAHELPEHPRFPDGA